MEGDGEMIGDDGNAEPVQPAAVSSSSGGVGGGGGGGSGLFGSSLSFGGLGGSAVGNPTANPFGTAGEDRRVDTHVRALTLIRTWLSCCSLSGTSRPQSSSLFQVCAPSYSMKRLRYIYTAHLGNEDLLVLCWSLTRGIYIYAQD